MTPVHKYPNYVTEVNVIDHEGPIRRRSRLDITLDRGASGSILFVLMNPSKATRTISDKTINAVIKYTYEKCGHNIGKIVVLNLYTVHETASGKLGSIVARYGLEFASGNDVHVKQTNDMLLESEAKKASLIIVGWGKPNATQENLHACRYHKRVLNTLQLLKPYDIYHFDIALRENIYPKHPRNINYSWPLTKLNVSSLIELIDNKYGQE